MSSERNLTFRLDLLGEEPENPRVQSTLPGRNQNIHQREFFKIHQRSLCVTATLQRGMAVILCGYRRLLRKEGMLRRQSCPSIPSCTGSTLTPIKGRGEDTREWETEEWEWGALDVFSRCWTRTTSLCLVSRLAWLLNSFRLEERRLLAFRAVPAASSAPVRSQLRMSRHPQRKKTLQLSTLFSLLLPTSLLK